MADASPGVEPFSYVMTPDQVLDIQLLLTLCGASLLLSCMGAVGHTGLPPLPPHARLGAVGSLCKGCTLMHLQSSEQMALNPCACKASPLQSCPSIFHPGVAAAAAAVAMLRRSGAAPASSPAVDRLCEVQVGWRKCSQYRQHAQRDRQHAQRDRQHALPAGGWAAPRREA